MTTAPAPETSRAAERLARHVEWSDGFSLSFGFSIAPPQVHLVQDRTSAAMMSTGREQRVLRPTRPDELELVFADLLAQDGGFTWLEAIHDPAYEAGAWRTAWINLLLRVNERRELLRGSLTGGLMVVAHPELKADFRNAAPDLWSIRSLVFELPPGPSEVAAGFGRLGLLLSGVDPRVVQVTHASPQVQTAHDPLSPLPEYAQALLQAAKRSRARGSFDEALSFSAAVVRSYRLLVAEDPTRYDIALAQALTAYAVDLDSLPIPSSPPPLAIARESVDLLRATNDESRTEARGEALNNLGHYLVETGSMLEAIDAAREAVACFRAVAPNNPRPIYPSLATALGNLGLMLGTAGQIGEGIEAAREAVEVAQNFGEPDPVIDTLRNYAALLTGLGRYEEAISACSEAIRLLGSDTADDRRPALVECLRLGGA